MFLLKVVVRKLYVFDYFIDGTVCLMPLGRSYLNLIILLNLPFDELILKAADILVESLNYWIDFFQEYSREFLVILIVLADHSNLMTILLLPVEPL